ncbi:MAG: bifunctional 4-hydroxy-2-oxoglutarate aldolase/2-dehydro-3-deoxy-phosphogluconate aldolase [Neisseriales bacterium]|nr:MAG: bifunctional 4-hydroxy-2-oxoglutarate aldolase/2-dehydro-3-deoxy-phosphogluconate aldolase [Neisseriales bacterium]
MRTVEQIFAVNKIVPVVVIDDVDAAIPLAETLLESGINAIEVTLRTPNALEIIELLAKKVPQILVGAGTVRTSADFFNACVSGAKLVFSPGTAEELLAASRSRYSDVRFIPGVVTPSHVMECASRGLNYLKFFPAEPFNAYDVLKSMASPLSDVKFCPTGGITIDNMQKYLELPNIFAIGMSSIVDSKLIIAHDFKEIRRRCEQAVSIVNNSIKK